MRGPYPTHAARIIHKPLPSFIAGADPGQVPSNHSGLQHRETIRSYAGEVPQQGP